MSAFDDLQRQLSKSVGDRANPDAATATTTTRPRRRWWTTRPFALALVGLTVAGSATAATVALNSEPSDPLVTRLPALQDGRPQLFGADRYVVAFTPDLQAGHAGWCLSSGLTRKGRVLIGTGGCNYDAQSRGTPVLAQSSSGLAAGPDFRTKQWFYTAIVDDRVAAIRVQDGRVLRPVSDPGLPPGFKAVVALGPGETKAGFTPTFYDEDGKPSAAVRDALRSTRSEDSPFSEPLPSERARPGVSSPWGLTSADPDVRIGAGRVLSLAPKATPNLNGRPFLVAASARIAVAGREYQASYLIDAARPGAEPAEIAGGVRDPSTGLVSFRPDQTRAPATARREGRGWLVVRGPGAARRAEVLTALRSGPLPGDAFPGVGGPG